jgi:hypothetical protein
VIFTSNYEYHQERQIPVERYLQIEFADVFVRLSHQKPVKKKKPIEAETNSKEMCSTGKT